MRTLFSVVLLSGCSENLIRNIPGEDLPPTEPTTGTAVTEREVYSSHLFHTYMRAVGVDPTKNFYPNDRPVPIADPKAAAIDEILI